VSTGDANRAVPNPPTYIRRIWIDGLFGYLSYRIPSHEQGQIDFDRLMILYGDNGSGKTTILSLVFCLLSPQEGRSEKTFIARTPFRHLEVIFDDGSIVSAIKPQDQLVGSYKIIISQPNAMREEYAVEPEADGAVKPSADTTKLLQRLAKIGIGLYYLADDRRVRTTFPLEPLSSADEPEGEEPSLFTVPYRASAAWLTSPERVRMMFREEQEEPRGSHHLNIAPVLANVGLWFKNHVFQGSSAGEENATSIYLRVVEQIKMPAGSQFPAGSSYEYALADRIKALANRVELFTRFGLITPFPAEKFLDEFEQASAAARRTIATVIQPYIDGVEARLNALETIRAVILTYVETMNEFLREKRLEFSLQSGATIAGHGKKRLDPTWLSSGEKQLVLLLSNTILARDVTGIFLIDEPELSLNVKWQRGLVDALLRCSKGSNIQYLLATHSLELITQHRQNAVQLRSIDSASNHARPVPTLDR
jgi:ABC-type lipoprotein export system ATPase subunit